MCILFVAINQHPNYPLIIAANRDEFSIRPTAPMQWWQRPNILAGKDLQAGGTWLGLSPSGRFSALTNYRQIPQTGPESPLSRGKLVVRALEENDRQLKSFLESNSQKFQGFNLLYGDSNQLSCYDSINKRFTHFTKGFFSVSNGAVNDIWPKMAKGEKALEHYVTNTARLSHADLLTLLKDDDIAPADLLPNTGLSLDWEQKLSAIFIAGTEYHTRSSCVLTVSANKDIAVTEVSYSNVSEIVDKQSFSWSAI